jgi:hypothetical protein
MVFDKKLSIIKMAEKWLKIITNVIKTNVGLIICQIMVGWDDQSYLNIYLSSNFII